jgi:hypothetical protein
MLPASEQPTPAALDRLAHEYSFMDELDRTWAVRPLELERDRGQTVLVLEDPNGNITHELGYDEITKATAPEYMEAYVSSRPSAK